MLAADCCVCCVRCHVTGCLVVDARVDGALGLMILVWGLRHCLGIKEGSVTTFPPRTTNLALGVITASIDYESRWVSFALFLFKYWK